MYPKNDKFSFKNKITNSYDTDVKLPVFQINRFKDIVCLRFNEEFVSELLALSSKVKPSKLIDGLIEDIKEILDNPESECFITEYYHMGKLGNLIYVNMNNKCCALFYAFLENFISFPPHIIALKQRLEKMSIQGNIYDSISN